MKYLCDKRKIRYVVITCLILLLFTACTSTLGRDILSQEAYQRAIEAGILAQVEGQQEEETRRNLVEVIYTDIIHSEANVVINLDTSQIRELHFERDEVRLQELYVSANQYVAKGDVLAVGTFDARELEAEIEILQLALEREEQAFARDIEHHEDILWEMRVARHQITDPFEWETQNLRIQRQEMVYEHFLSRQEDRLARYREQLDELLELLEGEKIIAPFDGIIISSRDIPRGTVMRSGETLLGIIAPKELQFTVTGHIDTIRYGDRFPATISNPPFEFEVQVVSDPLSTDTREETYIFVVQPVDREWFWDSLYELEVEYLALRNLRISGSPIRHEIHNVLTIPRLALRDHDDEVYVLLYEDGEVKIRFVEIGFRDDTNVQILSGLKAGQLVVR